MTSVIIGPVLEQGLGPVMLLTVSTTDGDTQSLELPDDLKLDDFKAILEAELNITREEMIMVHSGSELSHSGAESLKDCGLISGDLLLIADRRSMGHHFSRPGTLSSSGQGGPLTAGAARAKGALDELDSDVQLRLEEEIRQSNIIENMAAALEHHPEAFAAPVPMLFVRMTVNGHHISGFVDTGAQSSIITEKVAERCGLLRLIDRRFAGVAHGVGTGKILGRVHSVVVSVGGQHLSCSLNVMEAANLRGGPEVIFGLDMLKRHQVVINFVTGTLIIHGEAVPFLSEVDAPKFFHEPSI